MFVHVSKHVWGKFHLVKISGKISVHPWWGPKVEPGARVNGLEFFTFFNFVVYNVHVSVFYVSCVESKFSILRKSGVGPPGVVNV